MKRIISLILMMAMCVSLLCGMGISAHADILSTIEKIYGVSGNTTPNATTSASQKSGSTGGGITYGSSKSDVKIINNGCIFLGDYPSLADLSYTGYDRVMKLPHDSYYLSQYEYKYVKDGGYGPSVYVLANPDNGLNKSNLLPDAWQGTKVAVVAVRHNYSCCIYFSYVHGLCAGWIQNDYLCDSFTGTVTTCGQPAKGYEVIKEEIVPAYLSDDWMKDTRSEFTMLVSAEPCISLTLDYQVIGRNGVKAYGLRDVYYYCDNEWVKHGSFTVNEGLDPAHYVMNFSEPKAVQAVAVLPSDMSTQGFDFRLDVVDRLLICD